MISSQSESNVASTNKPEVVARVIDVVVAEMDLSATEVTLDSTFEELGIDSLNGLSIMTELENSFHVRVANDAIAQIRTVGDVVEAIGSLMGQKYS